MFVVQVDFRDQESSHETVIIRRLHARIGTTEDCHLILDGVPALDFCICLNRGLGVEFSVLGSPVSGKAMEFLSPWKGRYKGCAEIDLGEVLLMVVCIPVEIATSIIEFNDVNISQALKTLPRHNDDLSFPALIMLQEPFLALSLSEGNTFRIGRSRKCIFRLDNIALQPIHALLSSSTGQWSIGPYNDESLLLVNGAPVSAKVPLGNKDQICLADGISFGVVYSKNDVEDFVNEIESRVFESGATARDRYLDSSNQCILTSEHAFVKPQALSLRAGQTISIGRDPSHTVWVDSPHVSRLHCTILVGVDSYTVYDFSTNGTFVNGKKLGREDPEVVESSSEIIISLGKDAQVKLSPSSEVINSRSSEVLSGSSSEAVSSLSLFEERGHRAMEELKMKITEKASQEEEEKQFQELGKNAFAEFQKRSVRLMEETGQHPLLPAGVSLEDDFEESVIRIGFRKYIPQVVIVVLILLILSVFLVLSANMIGV